MPIKRRSNLPTEEDIAKKNEPKPLNIVAKPKTPIPEGGKVRDVYGIDAPTDVKRRLGPLAVALADKGELFDDKFTIEDRVNLLRSASNPPNTAEGRQERRYRNRVRNRGTAITAFCMTCVGSRKAVTECIDTSCPLWAFRFGGDPFYAKSKK